MILSLIASFALMVFSFEYAIEFSSFTVGLFKYLMAISIFYVIDKFYLKNIDTIELVGKEPVAYAIFVLANAVMLSMCIATS